MTDTTKIKPTHVQRAAIVYVRQSTTSQVEQHRESTARQYALAERARQLGWTKEQVILIDEDLGLSGASVDKRTGFARLTTEVAFGRVGIVLGLEVSRLARNNADWYRLLDLCGLTDTLEKRASEHLLCPPQARHVSPSDGSRELRWANLRHEGVMNYFEILLPLFESCEASVRSNLA